MSQLAYTSLKHLCCLLYISKHAVQRLDVKNAAQKLG